MTTTDFAVCRAYANGGGVSIPPTPTTPPAPPAPAPAGGGR
ncbi:hypothetical protein ACFVXH_39745 [Kitasatospora sp. NPDC058184]